jgi:retron-type reverse transcriptase
MGKKYKNLIQQVSSMTNLYQAYEKAAKGKRYTYGHLQFKQHLAANLKMLSSAILDGSYRPSPPNIFFVNEPKRREISALPFADRVVQHALCNIISTIFERTFLPTSYACRRNKGTHIAAIEAQAIMRKGYTHWLKMDFSKYFASIDREILYVEINRKISCSATLELINTFLPKIGVGIPIGNLTSQLFANIYGHIFDKYLTHTLHVGPWLRYMDDTVVFAKNKEDLIKLQNDLENFSKNSLKLRFSKWSIGPITQGLEFLGYRIWSTHKLLRKQSVIAAKRKMMRYRHDEITLNRFISSWKGHAAWANSHNLLTKLGIVENYNTIIT